MTSLHVMHTPLQVSDPLIFSGRKGACECDNFNCEINPTTDEICSGEFCNVSDMPSNNLPTAITLQE